MVFRILRESPLEPPFLLSPVNQMQLGHLLVYAFGVITRIIVKTLSTGLHSTYHISSKNFLTITVRLWLKGKTISIKIMSETKDIGKTFKVGSRYLES